MPQGTASPCAISHCLSCATGHCPPLLPIATGPCPQLWVPCVPELVPCQVLDGLSMLYDIYVYSVFSTFRVQVPWITKQRVMGGHMHMYI